MGIGYQGDQFTATTKALESYSGWKYADPQDIRIGIERQKNASTPIPTKRTDIDEEVAKLLLLKDINAYAQSSQQYRPNKANIYSLALRQFTEAINNRLEGVEIYEEIDGESYGILLLLLIKSIAY